VCYSGENISSLTHNLRGGFKFSYLKKTVVQMISSARSFVWSSASRTHVGKVRKLNEDSCLSLSEMGLWVVADGMGGHASGDVASQMVVNSLRLESAADDLNELVSEVCDRLQKVNQQLINIAALRHKRIIGSTVVILLAEENNCVCLWAGDSRIYRFRNHILQRLTRDHSQVEALIAQGIMNREQAEALPISSAITRAVGVGTHLQMDLGRFDVRSGDVFLLCSDGLNNEVGDDEIATLLGCCSVEKASSALVELALQRGARDNVTVTVVQAKVDVKAQD